MKVTIESYQKTVTISDNTDHTDLGDAVQMVCEALIPIYSERGVWTWATEHGEQRLEAMRSEWGK